MEGTGEKVKPSQAKWLASLTKDAVINRPWIKKTWWIDLDGREWSFATNGKVCVYVAGRIEGTEPAADTLKVARDVSLFFWPGFSGKTDYKAKQHSPCLASRIKEWCGEPQTEQPCPSCLGTARTSPNVLCTFCDGDGTMGPDFRPGRLFGTRLDRNLMARALAGLECGLSSLTDFGQPAEWLGYALEQRADPGIIQDYLTEHGEPLSGLVTVYTTEKERPVWVVSRDWRVVQMPLENAPDGEQCEEFQP
jgi:hypothetical protein